MALLYAPLWSLQFTVLCNVAYKYSTVNTPIITVHHLTVHLLSLHEYHCKFNNNVPLDILEAQDVETHVEDACAQSVCVVARLGSHGP
jgi:hypothetical protein